MLAELIDIINETFSPLIEVTGDTSIKNDLQLDSFEIIHLMCVLEDKYKMEFDDMNVSSLVTVDDICNYITNM